MDSRALPRVQVEVRFNPNLFPEAVEDLGARLGSYLLKRSPRLRQLESYGEGELDLQFIGPGELTKRWSKF